MDKLLSYDDGDNKMIDRGDQDPEPSFNRSISSDGATQVERDIDQNQPRPGDIANLRDDASPGHVNQPVGDVDDSTSTPNPGNNSIGADALLPTPNSGASTSTNTSNPSMSNQSIPKSKGGKRQMSQLAVVLVQPGATTDIVSITNQVAKPMIGYQTEDRSHQPTTRPLHAKIIDYGKLPLENSSIR